eukprot:TRINITY_DN1770_c4_g1_i1.p1 TRINITY_DN1770_c4_g1~~TRINITY_DN1770_c4_g1_i1.p1  ORF type:complete len:560 (+),score=69.55 TRINITY_DN1770_c4_g1_i1:91-1770(+)
MVEGYQSISENDEPSKGPLSFLDGTLKSTIGIVAFLGCVLCVIGEVLLWIKINDLCANVPCDANHLGSYALIICMIAFANLYSHAVGKPQLMWVTVTVWLTIINDIVCNCHLQVKNGDEHTIIAAWILLLVGVHMTMLVIPLDGFNGIKVRQIAAILISVLIIVGNIVLWSKGEPCSDNSISFEPSVPIFFVMWYLFSAICNYTAGLELSFMFAGLQLSSFQPFAACDLSECKAGTALIFCGLLSLILFHLMYDCQLIATDLADVAANVKDKRMPIVVILALVSMVGAVLVWTSDPGPSDSQSFHVVMIFLVAFLSIALQATRNPGLCVLLFCFTYANINLMLVPSGIISKSDGQARTGYLFVLLATSSLFVSFPAKWNLPSISMFAENDRSHIHYALVLICSFLYLSSSTEYELEFGFLGLVILASVATKFPHGLQWAYFISLYLAPQKNPYRIPDSTTKIVYLIIWIVLLLIIAHHISRFGMVAFENVRLFTKEDSNDSYEDLGSKPATESSRVNATTHVSYDAISAPPQRDPTGAEGDSFTYATEKPAAPETPKAE